MKLESLVFKNPTLRAFLLVAMAIISSSQLCAQEGAVYRPDVGPPLSGPRGIGQGNSAVKDLPHCTVSGVAVNKLTGEPIARALVMIVSNEQRSTLTDGEGRFTFEDVPKSQLYLNGQKPGFVPAMDRRGLPAVEACSSSSADIKVQLTPTSIVSGRMTDANGDPIEELPVRIGRWDFGSGRRSFVLQGATATDQDGRFRIADLSAGTYLLIAGPSQITQLETFRQMTPVVYFPGVPERKQAAEIELKAGASFDASMSIRDVPGFKIAGRIAGAVEGEAYMLQLTNESGDEIQTTAAAGHNEFQFRFYGVPAGNYRVRATAFGRSAQAQFGSASITVARDVSNVQIALAPPIQLRVQVRSEVTDAAAAQGAPVQAVILRPVRDGGTEAYGNVEGDPKNPRMVINNVEPGTYSAEFGTNGMVYVQSARLGSVDLLRDSVNIDSDQEPIEITVRDDGARVSGTVDGIALIVAIPSGGSVSPPKTQSFQQQDGSGHFEMLLAPGDYTLYAFDNFERIEYASPKVMEQYASKGVKISLSAKEKKDVTLKTIEVGR